MEWWKDGFFDEKIGELLFTEERREAAITDVEFIAGETGLSPEDKVLDLCCGNGRHSMAFAEIGMNVTAVDHTKLYLDQAKASSGEKELDIRFLRKDMKSIDFRSEFDLVVNLFTSFGYYSRQSSNRKVIERIGKALKPGGYFVIDIINRDWLLSNFRSTDWLEREDGTMFLEERDFDPLHDRMSNRWISISDCEMKVYTFQHYLYSLSTLREMVENADMKVKTYYGDLRGEEFERDSRRIVLFAQKNK